MTYNQLLNEHSLADTGTSEETNLSTTSIRGEQVDDLDTSHQHLGSCALLHELGCLSVDRPPLVRLDRAALVDGVASDVHDTAERGVTDRNHDGGAGVPGLGTTGQTLGT